VGLLDNRRDDEQARIRHSAMIARPRPGPYLEVFVEVPWYFLIAGAMVDAQSRHRAEKGELMDSEDRMTKQGVRDLNSLGPKKKTANGEHQEGVGDVVSAPSDPVLEPVAGAASVSETAPASAL
jgi:hypothetical protein